MALPSAQGHHVSFSRPIAMLGTLSFLPNFFFHTLRGHWARSCTSCLPSLLCHILTYNARLWNHEKKRIEANTSPLISTISSTHWRFPGIHAWKTIWFVLCAWSLYFYCLAFTRRPGYFMSRDSRLAPRLSYIIIDINEGYAAPTLVSPFLPESHLSHPSPSRSLSLLQRCELLQDWTISDPVPHH